MAGDFSFTVCRPPSTSRVTRIAIALDHDLGREGALRPAEQGRQHLAGLVAVVVDRLLAHDDETGLFRVDNFLEDLRHRQRLDRRIRPSPGCRDRRPSRARCGWSPTPAPRRSKRRRSRSPCRLPSDGSPLRRRSRRTGSSTFSRWPSSTPDPSDFTRTFTLKSTTRFTGTRIFMSHPSEHDAEKCEAVFGRQLYCCSRSTS